VLQHVRHAVQLGGLVPRAAGDPDAERRRFHLGHGVDRHAQAVGKRGDLDAAHGRTARVPGMGAAPPFHTVVDQRLQRRHVVGAGRRHARAAHQIGEPRRQLGPLATRRPLHRVRELRRMGAGQHHHRHLGIAAMLLGDREADGSVRVERLAVALAASGDRRERARLVQAAGIEQPAYPA